MRHPRYRIIFQNHFYYELLGRFCCNLRKEYKIAHIFKTTDLISTKINIQPCIFTVKNIFQKEKFKLVPFCKSYHKRNKITQNCAYYITDCSQNQEAKSPYQIKYFTKKKTHKSVHFVEIIANENILQN
jgi:hypothetical protein